MIATTVRQKRVWVAAKQNVEAGCQIHVTCGVVSIVVYDACERSLVHPHFKHLLSPQSSFDAIVPSLIAKTHSTPVGHVQHLQSVIFLYIPPLSFERGF